MSTRNLKKLLCQQVPDECQAAVVDELFASSPSVQSVSKPCNRFDLLKNVQDESDDDVNDDDEVDEPDETPPTSKEVAKRNKRNKEKRRLKHSKMNKKATYLKIVEKHLNYENERERKFKTQTKTFIQKNKSKSKKQPLLMPGKVNWTRLPKNTGLSMKLIGGSKPKTFKFVYSHSLQKCQKEFLRGVKKMDVGIFEAILVRNPFHIESILLLSDLYKLNKDLELSVELVERGLHYMEHMLHPMFSLTKPNCSLPFKYRENRAFFVLLFKHVLNVSRQSLYRTALELTKLILALDMTDPLAVVLFLDYYAIRSGEFRWLLEFYEAYDEEKKLRQLPNFAFSVAISHYRLGNKTQANDQLMKAIVQYPRTVFHLLEKCNYDIKKCLYQVHVFKNYFSCPKRLTCLIDLYVHRNVSVWRDNHNQLLIWLESVLLANFDDLKSLLPDTPRYATLYKDLKVTYKGIPCTVLRHLMVANVKEMAPIYFEYGGRLHFFGPSPPHWLLIQSRNRNPWCDCDSDSDCDCM